MWSVVRAGSAPVVGGVVRVGRRGRARHLPAALLWRAGAVRERHRALHVLRRARAHALHARHAHGQSSAHTTYTHTTYTHTIYTHTPHIHAYTHTTYTHHTNSTHTHTTHTHTTHTNTHPYTHTHATPSEGTGSQNQLPEHTYRYLVADFNLIVLASQMVISKNPTTMLQFHQHVFLHPKNIEGL